MKLLAFSDLHTDLDGAASLVEAAASTDVDVVIGAGDFASQHEELEPTIEALAAIERPTLLVPGNNETTEALSAAVAAAGWEAAEVLHGSEAEHDGIRFFGLGAGIPITPWDWSFDLDEVAAGRILAGMPEGCVLIVHSPPQGHVDEDSSGKHLGSEAIAAAIAAHTPQLAVCGHIHDSWGRRSTLGDCEIVNLGPAGTLLEV